MSPCGIDRGERLALCILQCVEQYSSLRALADTALERRFSRQFGSDHLANDCREGARLRIRVNRFEWHVDVKSGRTGRFQVTDEARGEQHFVNRAGHAKNRGERRVWRGIKIKKG